MSDGELILPAGVEAEATDPAEAVDRRPTTSRLVNQDRYWWDVDDQRQCIDEMHLSYLLNVLQMLKEERHSLLSQAQWIENEDRGADCELLLPGCPRANEYDDAEGWLRETPLHKALVAEVRQRGAGSVPEAARQDRRPDRQPGEGGDDD